MTRKPSPHLEADRLLAVQVAYEIASVLRINMPMRPNDFFRSTRGDAKESLARQIAVYVLVRGFQLNMQRAGDAIGRHRTTLTNALDVIHKIAVESEGFSAFLDELVKKCRRGVDLGNLFAQCELAVAPEDESEAA